ncbi:uncharacterized protein METZ01_LOCUS16237, partial [marine metagenome]
VDVGPYGINKADRGCNFVSNQGKNEIALSGQETGLQY